MMDSIFKKINKFLFSKRKPELMDRLSHLIVIQVFFVFSALLIIILYPKQDLSTLEKNSRISAVIENLKENLDNGFENNSIDLKSKEADKIIDGHKQR